MPFGVCERERVLAKYLRQGAGTSLRNRSFDIPPLSCPFPPPACQKITYEEFLPALVGHKLEPYSGYDDTVDPRVATEFATAGFRLGHSMVADDIEFPDNDGIIRFPLLLTKDHLFKGPLLVDRGGIDLMIK